MKWIFMLLFVAACGSALVQDNAPSPIEEGQKRVETDVCGSHGVGENGCILSEGNVAGTLKIFKVYEGQLSIIGLGCNVDYTTSYDHNYEDWFEIDLVDLVGPKLDNDCVLTITQKVEWRDGERTTFPIKDFRGTVTLATCPAGVKCSMGYEQRRLSDPARPLAFSAIQNGKFILSGCGKELIPPTNFSGPLKFDLAQYLPTKADTGCMFILGAKGEGQHKVYHKIWTFSDKVRAIALPALTIKKNKVHFTKEASVLAVSIDGYISSRKYFEMKQAGNYLRFYTSQGRSLIMFIKEGKIVWTK